MQELIKIAANGQWNLEKAKKPTFSAEEMERMISNFKAKQSAPVAPRTQPGIPQGLRAADVNSGNNPTYSKEQVAEQRARANTPDPTSPLAVLAGTKGAKAPKVELSDREKHIQRTQKQMERQQASDDEKALARRGNKGAFLQTAKMLGAVGGEKKEHSDVVGNFAGKKQIGPAFGTGTPTEGGNKGWANMAQDMEQRAQLDEAHRTGVAPVRPTKPSPQIMGPQEIFQDAQGNSQKRVRPGKFHNEGYRTRGKIVERDVHFPTGKKDENDQPIFAKKKQLQQEEHHLRWDHPSKSWQHVKTVHVPLDKG